MTRIEKPITRETEQLYHGRILVVTLHQRSMEFRLKGLEESVFVPYDAVFDFALRIRSNARS